MDKLYGGNMGQMDTLDSVLNEWEEIFRRLDKQDGVQDGRINKTSFLAWLDTLSLQETVMLEKRNGLSREAVRWLVERTDKNQDDYIDKKEFLALFHKESHRLDRIQRNSFLKAIRVVAYADSYRWCPPPLCMVIISLVQIFVHLYDYFFYSAANVLNSSLPLVCSQLIYNPWRRHEIWRFITYIFSHGGVMHISINVALQLVVGVPLEMTNSWWRVCLVYLLGALAGSLASSLILPTTYLAGASGGVYSLTTAHIAAILLNWREDSLILAHRLDSQQPTMPTYGKVVRVLRLLVVGGLLSVDIISSIYSVFNGGSSTSYVAHWTGALVGLLAGVVVLKNRRVVAWESWVRAICFTLVFAILLSMVLFNIFKTDHFPPIRFNVTAACSNL